MIWQITLVLDFFDMQTTPVTAIYWIGKSESKFETKPYGICWIGKWIC